jgi:hypothetical protein
MRIGMLLGMAMLIVPMVWLPHAAATQTPPTRVFGTVTVDGRPAPAGTVVQAFIGEQQCGEGQVRRISDTLPLGYVVDVVSATQTQGCGTDGDRITFRVGGRQATETGEFRTGAFLRLDLSVSGQIATPTPGPTPPPFGTATAPAGGAATATATTMPGGSPTAAPSAATATATAAPSPTTTQTATATGTMPPAEVTQGDGGGSAAVVWAVLAVVVLAAAGGVGYAVYRHRR